MAELFDRLSIAAAYFSSSHRRRNLPFETQAPVYAKVRLLYKLGDRKLKYKATNCAEQRASALPSPSKSQVSYDKDVRC